MGETKLPTVVWNYTSGNVQLSRPTLKWLKDKKIQMTLILYNPLMKGVLSASVRHFQNKLGEKNVQFSELSTTELYLPEYRYQFQVTPHHEMLGKKVVLQVTGKLGKSKINPVSVVATVPQHARSDFWARYGRDIILISLILLMALVGAMVIARRAAKDAAADEVEAPGLDRLE